MQRHDFAEDIERIGRIDAVPKLLEVVRKTTDVGFVAIARVTEDRWVTCAVKDVINFGLEPGGELPVETTLCNEVRQGEKLIVFDDAEADETYCGHPTVAMYGFRSYIAAPIRKPDGEFFGTLCAIDPRPLPLSEAETVEMFTLFGELVGFHLDAQDKLATSEQALSEERATGDLRDQFVAVLGHDLRGPLASISAASRLLQRGGNGMSADQILSGVDEAVGRMAKLIDDVLDYARGTLGGGIPVARAEHDVSAIAEQVVDEVRLAHPETTLTTVLPEGLPARCDAGRVGQLVSNLVSNAVHHGSTDEPIIVTACEEDGWIDMTVENAGPPVPEAARARLFAPFKRSETSAKSGGLGLGLFIASEIAAAHGGTLAYEARPNGSRFTFHMPSGR